MALPDIKGKPICAQERASNKGRGWWRMVQCALARLATRVAGFGDMVGGRLQRHDGRLTAPLLTLFAALIVMGSPARAAPDARTLNLVALGDSLTAGYRLPADAAFPAVLERALKAKGHTVTVANAGVSGDTTTGGLDRLEWSVPDGTDGVILELGANDMLRGTDPAVTMKALDAIVTRLKARGIPVLMAGMRASTNLGPDFVNRFDAIYPSLSEQYGLVLYPFFLDGIAGDRAFNLDDGLHPNVKGVERIVGGILPTVESFLHRIQDAPR
jgi:acyl-CoA thioesterase I